MKRKPFYLIPLIVAASYTAILLIAGALAINPYIAQLHPESIRYQVGAYIDHIFPVLTAPIIPLAWFLKGLDTGQKGLGYLLIFLYAFCVACLPVAFIRRMS